jgi:hypothetical protein
VQESIIDVAVAAARNSARTADESRTTVAIACAVDADFIAIGTGSTKAVSTASRIFRLFVRSKSHGNCGLVDGMQDDQSMKDFPPLRNRHETRGSVGFFARRLAHFPTSMPRHPSLTVQLSKSVLMYSRFTASAFA